MSILLDILLAIENDDFENFNDCLAKLNLANYSIDNIIAVLSDLVPCPKEYPQEKKYSDERNPLLHAILLGHQAMAKTLYVRYEKSLNNVVLCKTISLRQIGVSFLLNLGVDLELVALNLLLLGNFEAVQMLIQCEAISDLQKISLKHQATISKTQTNLKKVRFKNDSNIAPYIAGLSYAIKRGDLVMVIVLMTLHKKGEEWLEYKGEEDKTLLQIAIECCDPNNLKQKEIISVLLRAGAQYQKNSILCSIFKKDHDSKSEGEFFNWIVLQIENINPIKFYVSLADAELKKTSPLCVAANCLSVILTNKAIVLGFSLNPTKGHPHSALVEAALNDDDEFSKKLIQGGASYMVAGVSIAVIQKELHGLTNKSPGDFLTKMISRGIDIDQTNVSGKKPLRSVVRHDRDDLLQILVDAGVEITSEDLDFAQKKDAKKCQVILQNIQALDRNARNVKRYVALIDARFMKNQTQINKALNLFDSLLTKEDKNSKNAQGNCFFEQAVFSHNFSLAESLLEKCDWWCESLLTKSVDIEHHPKSLIAALVKTGGAARIKNSKKRNYIHHLVTVAATDDDYQYLLVLIKLDPRLVNNVDADGKTVVDAVLESLFLKKYRGNLWNLLVSAGEKETFKKLINSRNLDIPKYFYPMPKPVVLRYSQDKEFRDLHDNDDNNYFHYYLKNKKFNEIELDFVKQLLRSGYDYNQSNKFYAFAWLINKSVNDNADKVVKLQLINMFSEEKMKFHLDDPGIFSCEKDLAELMANSLEAAVALLMNALQNQNFLLLAFFLSLVTKDPFRAQCKELVAEIGRGEIRTHIHSAIIYASKNFSSAPWLEGLIKNGNNGNMLLYYFLGERFSIKSLVVPSKSDLVVDLTGVKNQVHNQLTESNSTIKNFTVI